MEPTEPAFQPDVTIPAPPPPVRITVIHTQPLKWFIECDTPTDYALVFRSEVAWWNTQSLNIFAPEGDFEKKEGLRFWFAPEEAPRKAGLGGPWGAVVLDRRLVIGFLVTVTRHELGHAIGLGHGGGDDCLMDDTTAVPWQELCAAEVEALATAYPQGVW